MLGGYLLKSLYSAEAALASYFPRARRMAGRRGKYVVLASMPKSGSTFLSNTLAKLLGYQHSYLAFAYQNVEQELYLPRMLDTFGRGTVVQQHFKANQPNLELLNKFRIKPVVLVRDIHDVVVSVRDHLVRERLDNIPSLHPPRAFPEFDKQKQLDFVVSFFGPWLVEFFVSWAMAEKAEQHSFLWLSYEDCVDNWDGALEKIAAYYDIEVAAERIGEVLSHSSKSANRRMNRGVVGRGAQELNAEQKRRITEMAGFYPDVDFTPLGIRAPAQ